MGKDTLTITDNRTGKSYEIPIEHGLYPDHGTYIRATDLRQIKVKDDEFGMLSHDPGFVNTSACKSSITFIDGDKGILRYRGYDIEGLAENSNFLEVAYLLVFGELPTNSEYAAWVDKITLHTMLHENTKKLMDSFWHDAHPMGMLVASLGALSTFYPESKDVNDPESRYLSIVRLIAKTPTMAALAYRHSLGMPYVYPKNILSYSGNFLRMLFKMGDNPFSHEVDRVLEKALDVLFILHADHEQNCSTSTGRVVGSSEADPFVSAAAAAGALYGPRHGGANEAVLRMLGEIGTKDNIPAFIKGVKAGEGRLMGFGHRVYKNFDPRAKIIKNLAHEVFQVTGHNPLLDIALELEKIALDDEYFIKRRLYPNVDFYSGLIYQAMKFPVAMFPVLFAIGRMPGWMAHWQELVTDEDNRIARPRQIYIGEDARAFKSMGQRG